MRVSRLTAAVALLGLSTPLLAAGESSMTSLTSATPGTYVLHNGTMSPARSGQVLAAGDRLVTYNGASAAIKSAGCTKALSSTSMMTVGTACDGTTTSLAAPQPAMAAGAADDEGGGGGATGYVVAAAAVLAIAGGVIAASSGSSKPNSP